mmetsp:Transcript_110959/g.203468  ORF Transcript_110959/g.203468 Transcript_110959/m.203468 type:complete len:321 (+) Transcript_110959:861-1823(+)
MRSATEAATLSAITSAVLAAARSAACSAVRSAAKRSAADRSAAKRPTTSSAVRNARADASLPASVGVQRDRISCLSLEERSNFFVLFRLTTLRKSSRQMLSPLCPAASFQSLPTTSGDASGKKLLNVSKSNSPRPARSSSSKTRRSCVTSSTLTAPRRHSLTVRSRSSLHFLASCSSCRLPASSAQRRLAPAESSISCVWEASRRCSRLRSFRCIASRCCSVRLPSMASLSCLYWIACIKNSSNCSAVHRGARLALSRSKTMASSSRLLNLSNLLRTLASAHRFSSSSFVMSLPDGNPLRIFSWLVRSSAAKALADTSCS